MTTTPHKILSVFIQTKIEGSEADWKESTEDLIKRAEKEDKMYRFKKDIHFCAYKTNYNNSPAIILLFTMLLPGPVSGSSASSELIMNFISVLESILNPLDDINLSRDIFNKKNIGVIRVTKKIRETDVI